MKDVTMSKSPISSLLGNNGDPLPTGCKVIVPGVVEVHWFPEVVVGTRCFCGSRVREPLSDEPEPNQKEC